MDGGSGDERPPGRILEVTRTGNQCPQTGSVSADCVIEFQSRSERRKGHKSCALQMVLRSKVPC